MMLCGKARRRPMRRLCFNYKTHTQLMKVRFLLPTLLLMTTAVAPCIAAQKVEPIKYGDFENWITRNIKESGIIGGKTKQVYAIGPTATINGDKPYTNAGGSPWASSNIMAKVVGITKTSNAVFPEQRSAGNRCCKMSTILENCKAIGLINIDVVVAGSIFLGYMKEPITSTSDPYSKMEMGIPFTRRPKALVYDYKVYVPEGGTRLYSSGFGKKKTLPGSDFAEAYIILQQRSEDADGRITARRVGTGRERFGRSTAGWQNGHRLPVDYGDITGRPDYKPWMGLLNGDRAYYARNSRGKMVPVEETGWADADATPTHMLVMFSSGCGEAYVGTVGMSISVDNIGLEY